MLTKPVKLREPVLLRDFKQFLLKQNVVALSIAVVVGAAFGKLVTAIVDDVIMPIVAVVIPGGAWRTAVWEVGPVKFGVGDLASAALNFLLIGFVAWRIALLFVKPETPAATKTCDFCLTTIPAAATRCPGCTSQLTAAA